jgi:secreted trypsin-like serine protease
MKISHLAVSALPFGSIRQAIATPYSDGVTTKIVGGNNAEIGEYPYFGESVQSTRRLKCDYIYQPKE